MNKSDPCFLGVANGRILQLLAVEYNSTAVAGVYTGQDIHQSGFSGSVFPQKRMHFSLLNRQRDIFQDLHATEGLIDPAHFQ